MQAVRTEQSTGIGTRKSTAAWKQKAPRFLATMFLLGATIGPAVDGIHGQVHLVSTPRIKGRLQLLCRSDSADWKPLSAYLWTCQQYRAAHLCQVTQQPLQRLRPALRAEVDMWALCAAPV